MYEGRTAGRWLDINPLIMHSLLSLAVAAIALCLPTQALAADERAFNVPTGSLSSALPLISRQAGVSISVADAKLWQARVKPVRGRISVEKAVRSLLDGSDARAVRFSAKPGRTERPPPHPARART